MSDNDIVHVLPEPTIVRCTRGHEWKQDYGDVDFVDISLGGKLTIKDLCPFCLREWLVGQLIGIGRREKGDVSQRGGLFEAVDKQIGQAADSLSVTSNMTWDNGETQSIGGWAWVREEKAVLPIPFSVEEGSAIEKSGLIY